MKTLFILLFISTSLHAATNEELARKIDILADEISALKASQLNIGTGQTAYGLGQAASKVYFINSGLSIGGYGEITYSAQATENEDGDKTNRDPKAEALRNIIYIGYKFNDKWILNTEIEIEHVNEVFTEFMYVDYLASTKLNYRFGLSLVPMGLTNELHEPIYFNSVNRPDIERFLIPSTWRELGVGVFGTLGNFDYKAFLFNGPNGEAIAGNQSNGIRNGRKKGGADNSDANQNAATSAVVLNGNYRFDSSKSLGGSIYKGEASSLASDNNPDPNERINKTTNLEIQILEAHGQFKHKGFGAKFLYTLIDFTNANEWNNNTSDENNKVVEQMNGFYIEFEYDINGADGAVFTPFIRYSEYDLNNKLDKSQVDKDKSLDRRNIVAGLAYKPIDRVIFKLDYTNKSNKADSGINEVNLGLGFVY